DRGTRVARHLELWDHLDVPRRGIAQDVDVVRAGKKTAAPGPIDVRARAKRGRKVSVRIGRVAASRAHGSELREARNLDPPAFVVCEMDVVDIELVARNEVERAQHGGFRVEIAGNVEHEPAVPETGSIYHADGRQDKACARSGCGQEATQRLETVEDAGGRGANDVNALDGIHDERVRLGRGLTFHGTHLESYGRAACLAGASEVGAQVLRRERR